MKHRVCYLVSAIARKTREKVGVSKRTTVANGNEWCGCSG